MHIDQWPSRQSNRRNFFWKKTKKSEVKIPIPTKSTDIICLVNSCALYTFRYNRVRGGRVVEG